MKSTCFVVLVLACVALAQHPSGLPSSFEVASQHLDRIFADDELVHGYFECLMDRGPCTPGGKDIKSILPDAFASDCNSCSEIQRSSVKKIIKFARSSKPDYLQEIEAKYDPEGKLRARIVAAKSSLGN